MRNSRRGARADPSRKKDGSRIWIYCTGKLLSGGIAVEFIINVTDRKRAEEERELLTRELSHRVRNTLAVVQSLAMQTDGRAQSVEAFREAFVGRLQALARAHGLLLDTNWRSADLKTLVEQATVAYRARHPEVIEIEGEPVTITAQARVGAEPRPARARHQCRQIRRTVAA